VTSFLQIDDTAQTLEPRRWHNEQPFGETGDIPVGSDPTTLPATQTLEPRRWNNEQPFGGTGDILVGSGSTTLPEWLKHHVLNVENAHFYYRPGPGRHYTEVQRIRESLIVKPLRKAVWMCTYRASNSSANPSADFWVTTRSGELLEDYERYNQPDWDGYDAEPIAPETLAAARAFLRFLPKEMGEPECSPGSDGSIGFEWVNSDRRLRKLFIDIGPSRTWRAYWRLASGETGTISRKPISLTIRKELTDLFARLGA